MYKGDPFPGNRPLVTWAKTGRIACARDTENQLPRFSVLWGGFISNWLAESGPVEIKRARFVFGTRGQVAYNSFSLVLA